MTCFSIQKSLLFGLLLAAFFGIPALPAHAQETKPPPEEIEKLKQLEAAEAEEASGKVDSPIVVELFTTADCTACVFADRILYDTMKNDKNVIALSCKIEDMSELYTKFETWRGTKEKRERQPTVKQSGPMDPCVFRLWTYLSAYSTNDVNLRIPTFIFNGYDRAIGGDPEYYTMMLNRYHYANKNKSLEVFMRWKDKDTITIHLPTDPKAGKTKRSASVWIVRYKDMAVEKVEKGMNKGRVLRFSNVIQDIKHIGKWHQQMRTLDIDVPAPQGGKERGGYAVLVQEMMGEPVLASGILADYPHPNDIKAQAEAKAKAEAAAKLREENRNMVAPKKAPEKTAPTPAPAP